MKRIVVIVPTRGRPHNIARLLDAWEETAATAHLLVAIDKDDVTMPEYMDVVSPSRCQVAIGDRRRLCGTLNYEAVKIAAKGTCDIVAFLGDDHVPRTPNWDRWIREAFDEMGSGIVYGNDLLQGATLPTAVFMSVDIVRALGYMAPPVLTHFWLDNAWKEWGEAMGRLRYLPDVTIEHMHPLNGKAEGDERYNDVNGFVGADEVAYRHYKEDGGFERDAQKLRRLAAGGIV